MLEQITKQQTNTGCIVMEWPDTTEEGLESIKQSHQVLTQAHKMAWESPILQTKRPLKDIARRTRKFDLLIVDHSSRSMFRKMLGLSVQRRMAHAAVCSVLQIKEHLSPKEESP